MKREKIDKILDYFYNLEFCSPFTPTEIVYDSNNKNQKLPKIPGKKSKDEKKKYVFTIYVGNFDYKKVLKQITDVFQIKNCKELLGITESTICGFKVDEEAYYQNGTFSLSMFVYALDKLLKEKSQFTKFDEMEFRDLQSKIEKKIDFEELHGQVSQVFLDHILDVLKEFFPDFSNYFLDRVQISEDLIYREAEEITPAILPSFYLQDLTMLKKNPDKKIADFLSLEEKNRISICNDIGELKRIIDPKNYPLGKWPSKFHPGLMQQVAINIGIRDNAPIFSVNGPPGSGKTTLVKEIIASVIVDRAKELVQFENPDDAFVEEKTKNPKNSFQSSFYKLNDSLKKYGILVASNNNNAVENITLELPIASSVKKDKTRTDLFDTHSKKEIYFTDLTNTINKKVENWGLISVRLGKKANINNFINALWFDKESSCKFQDYLADVPDYEACKVSFQKKLKEVEDYRIFLENVKKEVEEIEILKEKIKDKEEDLKSLQKQMQPLFDEHEKLLEELTTIEKKQKEYHKLIEDINKQIPWFVRMFPFLFIKNAILIKKKEVKASLENLILEHILKKSEKLDLDFKLQDKEKQEKELVNEIGKLEKTLEILNNKLKEYKDKEIVFADVHFFENISKNKESQIECPWTNKIYDTLREELFYEALQVHKSFVLNSKCFKKNLSLAVNMLKNSSDYAELKENFFGEILNCLFLLVPVISTTLASVERFLKDIKKDEIGYLIIDEAGQATPHSVLGAIYRAKKTIVLGDPLQIEPVVPTPQELYLVLDSKDQIAASFHDVTLSAQVLADIQNKYGELRQGEKDIWVGCPLLLHRRCLEPMFSISNKIAYNGKMFYCTEDGLDKEREKEEQKKDIFEISEWLDISGEEISTDNHYVREQGEKVVDFVTEGFKNNGAFPSLYIITPFKSIATEIRKLLISHISKITSYDSFEIKNWVNTHCGTVHTFQGKEAREVIFVLGCSHDSKGAVRWAGEKPNILNVAVSRAKRKVVIIGDVSLWKNVPNFSTAYKYLIKDKSKK